MKPVGKVSGCIVFYRPKGSATLWWIASIAVNRRQRRAKSDALAGRKLLRLLIRYRHGERQVWRVVHVPSVAAEEQRHLHRDLETVQQERARTTNRIKGLLRRQGVRLASVHTVPERLDALRLWDGSPDSRVAGVGVCYGCMRMDHVSESSRLRRWKPRRRTRAADRRGKANIEQGRQLMQLQRHRDQWIVGIGDGVFWLACVARIVGRWEAWRD